MRQIKSGLWSHVWELGADETGEAIIPPVPLVAASAQVEGVFNGGSVAHIEVSNDGQNWHATPLNGALSKCGNPSLLSLSTTAIYVRARAEGGSGTLTVTLGIWDAS